MKFNSTCEVQLLYIRCSMNLRAIWNVKYIWCDGPITGRQSNTSSLPNSHSHYSQIHNSITAPKLHQSSTQITFWYCLDVMWIDFQLNTRRTFASNYASHSLKHKRKMIRNILVFRLLDQQQMHICNYLVLPDWQIYLLYQVIFIYTGLEKMAFSGWVWFGLISDWFTGILERLLTVMCITGKESLQIPCALCSCGFLSRLQVCKRHLLKCLKKHSLLLTTFHISYRWSTMHL